MTPNQIIATALRHIGVLDGVETASGTDTQHMLGLMVSLLDAWQVSPWSITGTDELVYTPSAGTRSFTIGPAGNIVSTAPDRITRESYWRGPSGIDTLLDVGTLADYNSEADKGTTGQPSYVVLDRGSDTATVYLYPAADGVSQLRLVVASDVLPNYASLTATTSITLPAGMRNALEWSLAEEALSAYQVDPATESKVVRNARRARRIFGKANHPRATLSTTEGGRYNIYTD